MGSKTSRSCATENIKQIENQTLTKKGTGILVFSTLKDAIARVEKFEETKSHKIYYKLPPVNLCSYSLIQFCFDG